MKMHTTLFYGLITLSFSATASSFESQEAYQISLQIKNPGYYLKTAGDLVVMGNAKLDDAKIIFLPEVHDDPESLLIQLLLIAREKQNGKKFMVLDESLTSMQKSIWDIFSQKSLEIIAAKEQRRDGQYYVPQRFEEALQRLATKFRQTPGKLSFLKTPGIWTLSDFSNDATPFYGWDLPRKGSLTERNVAMVSTFKKALRDNDRLLVMAGARHVPELEFMTSQRLLCRDQRAPSIDQYFKAVERKYGRFPSIRYGIGATAPIYSFLKTQPYAVVFSKKLYRELDHVVEQFGVGDTQASCLKL